MTERRVTALVFAVCLIASAHAQKPDHRSPEPVATFSILGFDPATGEIGGAVQSRVFSVGNGVLWGEADVGMAATQAIVDVSYGPKALALLRAGLAPEATLKAIWDSDPDPGLNGRDWTKQGRQFARHGRKGPLRRVYRAESAVGQAEGRSFAPPRATFSRAKQS